MKFLILLPNKKKSNNRDYRFHFKEENIIKKFQKNSKQQIIGEHEVLFSSGKEIIKLNHEAFDRTLYSEGALSAASWLMKKNLVYTQ